ncbi:hypothetical protein HKX48_007516 [Thoreauomyces humboldtii]|nr:hypothetical protein HKX48_007516 [Thoreauomyces humboldtii]
MTPGRGANGAPINAPGVLVASAIADGVGAVCMDDRGGAVDDDEEEEEEDVGRGGWAEERGWLEGEGREEAEDGRDDWPLRKALKEEDRKAILLWLPLLSLE